MAAVDDIQKDGFSFTWTIQNFSHCRGIITESPEFSTITRSGVSEVSNEKWHLNVYPRGAYGADNIVISLKNGYLRKKKVSIDLFVYTSIGKFIHESGQKFFYSGDSVYVFDSGIRLIDLNKKKSGVIIHSNDSLTIICRIWNVDENPVEYGQFYLRTIIEVERIAYVWNIHNFQEELNKKNISDMRPPVVKKEFAFTMELSCVEGIFADDNIQITIRPIKPVKENVFTTCQMSLLDIDGKIVHAVRDEHYFNELNSTHWRFSFILKDKILSFKELYLPNGTLSLWCEFTVSSGVTYNEVEITEKKTAYLSKFENCKQEKDSDTLGSLKENLQSFYTDEKFSDLIIRTSSKEFPVHKTILCARSKVFSAMFENDTKEKLTGIVEIEDMDDDTVSKMLLFLYTDTVGEDLDFETASSLYFASDKYGIVVLKRKCSDLLKSNFTLTNVCGTLVLSDMHQDQELKLAAQKFIFEHSGEIMKSEGWKNLMENQQKLCIETMQLFFQNLKI